MPVAAAPARKGDIGVYLTGLGAVTPLNTITVKTRIDGELMTVSYREGHIVHKDAPLAVRAIDSACRPEFVATAGSCRSPVGAAGTPAGYRRNGAHGPAANEQIGIAKAAFFPSVLLNATGGFETTNLSQ